MPLPAAKIDTLLRMVESRTQPAAKIVPTVGRMLLVASATYVMRRSKTG